MQQFVERNINCTKGNGGKTDFSLSERFAAALSCEIRGLERLFLKVINVTVIIQIV